MTLNEFVALLKREGQIGTVGDTSDRVTSDIILFTNNRLFKIWRKWPWDWSAEDISITLTANELGTTGCVKIYAGGTVTGTTSTKETRMYFGATEIAQVSHAAAGQQDFLIDGLVCNDASATAQVFGEYHADQGSSQDDRTNLFGTAAVDTTANVTIKTTGETPNSADEVTSEYLIVNLFP